MSQTVLLPYLSCYPIALQEQVQALIDQQQLGQWLEKRYPNRHAIQSDKALFDYILQIKNQGMRLAAPLNKAYFDAKQHPVKGTLGTHTYATRRQGSKLKTVNEIRIAHLFKEAPEPFLKMIVVHELAHFKEKDHNKAFYQLCQKLEPNYIQLEFDTRIWLTWRELP